MGNLIALGILIGLFMIPIIVPLVWFVLPVIIKTRRIKLKTLIIAIIVFVVINIFYIICGYYQEYEMFYALRNVIEILWFTLIAIGFISVISLFVLWLNVHDSEKDIYRKLIDKMDIRFIDFILLHLRFTIFCTIIVFILSSMVITMWWNSASQGVGIEGIITVIEPIVGVGIATLIGGITGGFRSREFYRRKFSSEIK